jgi:antitoxin component YwqK of YwqJK toxin-antitoxin module
LKRFILLFLLFPFHFFPQITDSIVLIKNYFNPAASWVRFKDRNYHDSVVANTFPKQSKLRTDGKKYFVDNSEVGKEAFYAELQKQTDQRYKPFKRVEYYPSGQLMLRGNFFGGDGLIDSCYNYHPNGKLAVFSKVMLDTSGMHTEPGRNHPNIIQKTSIHKVYDKNGLLMEMVYSKEDKIITERYAANGRVISQSAKPRKQAK